MPGGLGGLRGSSLSGGLLSHAGSSQSALCTCRKLICSNGVTTVKRVPVEQEATQLRGGNGKQTRTWELRPSTVGVIDASCLWLVCVALEAVGSYIALRIPLFHCICRAVGAAVGNPASLLTCEEIVPLNH